MNDQIQRVRKIKEVSCTDQANTLLENGWILLSTSSTSSADKPYFYYSLGWTHDISEEEYLERREMYDNTLSL